MFLFECKRPLDALPPSIKEGRFGFFPDGKIDVLPVPETDRQLLWPIYWEKRKGFCVLRADCHQGIPQAVVVEEELEGK